MKQLTRPKYHDSETAKTADQWAFSGENDAGHVITTATVCLTVILTVRDNAQSRNQGLYADLAVQDLRMLNGLMTGELMFP